MAEGGDRGLDEDSELDKEKLKDIEDEGDIIAHKMQENVSQELNSHLAKLEEDFRTAFEDRVKAMTSQCQTQKKDEMTQRQTDILRTNKVFREICRPLGEKWKPVFDILLSDLSPDARRLEVEKVEREKPFMRPYKSLMTWKEVRGENFDVRDLVRALQLTGLEDLRQTTLGILDSDKDSLLSLSDASKAKLSSSGASGTAPKASLATAASAAGGASSDASASNQFTGNAAEILDDRHLLQVAKKLGSDWEPVAVALNVPKSEIAEILDGEGKTYQGGFKMLWNWRESKTNLQEAVDTMIGCLRQLKRTDVVDLLR